MKEETLIRIYEKKGLFRFLNVFSLAVSLLCVAVYASLLLLRLFDGDYLGILKLLITAGVPFFAVGVARSVIKAPRPYEIYGFYEKNPRKKTFGKDEGNDSFPSRHAYSSFVIATVAFFVNPILGCVVFVLGAAMCVCRVLAGIHFVKDVLCGALTGTVAGILGEFLINF